MIIIKFLDPLFIRLQEIETIVTLTSYSGVPSIQGEVREIPDVAKFSEI